MLAGKNAIITGARRGIGRATTEVFAENGSNVWACARKADPAFENDMKSLSERYGVIVQPLYFDIRDESQIKNAVMEIRKSKRQIDILVNNAGTAEESSSFPMTTIEKMKDVFEVNFFGATLLTQYVSRLMARQRCGSIVNVSSVAAIDGRPAQYEYVCSKAAVIGGVRQLARELAPNNIRVNAVAPGIVDTDMGALIDNELKETVISNVMMSRIAKPEEISNVIMFLASDLASYITGQVIRVDGGM